MKTFCKALAFITWFGGLIAGLIYGQIPVPLGTRYVTNFSLRLAVIYWISALLLGTLLLAAGTILENQERILTLLGDTNDDADEEQPQSEDAEAVT